MVIQVVVTIGIVLIVFPNIYSSYKKNNLTLFGLILWGVFWITTLVLIWFPSLMGILGKFLGVARSIDALVYLSIVLLLYLTFKQRIRISEVEKEITALTRKITLKDIKKK